MLEKCIQTFARPTKPSDDTLREPFARKRAAGVQREAGRPEAECNNNTQMLAHDEPKSAAWCSAMENATGESIHRSRNWRETTICSVIAGGARRIWIGFIREKCSEGPLRGMRRQRRAAASERSLADPCISAAWLHADSIAHSRGDTSEPPIAKSKRSVGWFPAQGEWT